MDLTYLEITRQYKTLMQTVKYFEANRHTLRQFYLDKKPKSIVFIGSGSSYYVAQSIDIIAHTHFGFYSFSLPAGDAMVNINHYETVFDNSMIVAISRSGNTTEILKTVTALKGKLELSVLGITCTEDSELCKAADLCLKMPWTFDESVCQTGSVTNLYAASALTLAGFADDDLIFEDIKKMIAAGDDFISKNEAAFKAIAERKWDKAVVLADGEISGLACEGALAFKEICGVFSNYYHVLDVRHGPMVLIDKDTLVIAALKPDNKKHQLDLISDMLKKGATVVVCTDDSYEKIEEAALHVMHPNAGNIAEGLPLINTIQMIAYYKAILKGLDPGNPQGLDAWIKL